MSKKKVTKYQVWLAPFKVEATAENGLLWDSIFKEPLYIGEAEACDFLSAVILACLRNRLKDCESEALNGGIKNEIMRSMKFALIPDLICTKHSSYWPSKKEAYLNRHL